MQNRIRENIIKSGRTQKEIAEVLGITTVGLNQIVNGGMPKLDTFAKIARVLDVPVWKLCLSDEELEEIRGAREEEAGSEFRCPRCGASLMVVPCDE